MFFALTSARPTSIGRFDQDAAVWILDPVEWNRKSLADMSYDGGILSTDDAAVGSFCDLGEHRTMQKDPVALYGVHNSQRIVAQRGVFTVFGKGHAPMEDICVHPDYGGDVLVKVVVPKDSIATLRQELLGYGVTESVVYPDLDGLAKEIKRQFGYEH